MQLLFSRFAKGFSLFKISNFVFSIFTISLVLPTAKHNLDGADWGRSYPKDQIGNFTIEVGSDK